MTRSKGGVVLLDGPAAGTYSVRRAPHFLRAVVDRRSGHADLLDQLSDQPTPGEAVYVYEADGPTWDSERMVRKGTFVCPPTGASGSYRFRFELDGERFRDTAAWREWCRTQPGSDTRYDPTEAPR